MTDIEIRHFLANFTFEMDAITLHYSKNPHGLWLVWIILRPQVWYYQETIPQAAILTEDDMLGWIMGFGIRAFASFLPSLARMRRDPAGKWECIVPTRSNHEGLARDQTPGTTG